MNKGSRGAIRDWGRSTLERDEDEVEGQEEKEQDQEEKELEQNWSVDWEEQQFGRAVWDIVEMEGEVD